MPFHSFHGKFNKPPIVQRRNKRNIRKEPPTITSLRESENERRNEKIQQDSINQEIDDSKRDMTELKSFVGDEVIKIKLQKLLERLPREDRLRNLVDEDKEQFNKNLSRSQLKVIT